VHLRERDIRERHIGERDLAEREIRAVLATGPNSRVGSSSGSARNRTVTTVLATPKTRPTGNGPVL